MEIKAFMDGQETIETLEERITGRFIAETITDPDTGEVALSRQTICVRRSVRLPLWQRLGNRAGTA